MILLSIDNSRDFMGKLLTSEAFDSFLLQEAVITSSVTYTVSGRVHRDFFSEGDEIPEEEFIPWPMVRGRIYELIKGKNPPVSLRITLSLKNAAAMSLIQKESPEGHYEPFRAFVVNIRFENGSLTAVTGTSYDTFVPDKSLDNIWDDAFKKFLTSREIEFTPQQ